MNQHIKKVLILRLSAIGDTIHTLPVAYAIKTAGGSPLVDEMYGKIWTITESDVAQIYCYVVQTGLYFPYNKNYSNSALYVRPIMEL